MKNRGDEWARERVDPATRDPWGRIYEQVDSRGGSHPRPRPRDSYSYSYSYSHSHSYSDSYSYSHSYSYSYTSS